MENKKTIQAWDKLAAESINSVLAPKGFEKITSGSYRGSEKPKGMPFLSKQRVVEARSVAAMMVREYRDALKKDLNDRLNYAQKKTDEATQLYSKLAWWDFKKKREAAKERDHYQNQTGLLFIIINNLNTTEIPKR